MHPLQPVARLAHERLEQAAWQASYPARVVRELQAQFDVQTALLTRLILAQRAACAMNGAMPTKPEAH
jgi:hypothetical protein